MQTDNPNTPSDAPVEEPILCGAIPMGEMAFDDAVAGVPDPPFLAMPYGTWIHPQHGKLVFTQEKAQRMAENHRAGVYGPRLPINYGHDRAGRAAGWVNSVEARDDGMYIHPAWTPPGREAVKNGEYGYTSVEFYDLWQHPKAMAEASEPAMQRYRDVLIGVGLTNIPFLKGRAGESQTEVHCAEFLGAEKPMKKDCAGISIGSRRSEDVGDVEGAEEEGEENVVPQTIDSDPDAEDDKDAIDPKTGLPVKRKKAKPSKKAAKKADDDEMNCADPQGPRGAKIVTTFSKLLERLRGLPQDAKPEDVEVALSEALEGDEPTGPTQAVEGDAAKAMAEVVALKAQVAAQGARIKQMADDAAAEKAVAAKSAAQTKVDAAVGKKLAPALKENEAGYAAMIAFAETNPAGFDEFLKTQSDIVGLTPKGAGHQESESAVTLSEADEMVCAEIARRSGRKVEEVRAEQMEITAARAAREVVSL